MGSILEIWDQTDVNDARKKPVKKELIIRWKQGKVIWVAINPNLLREPGDRVDLKRFQEVEPSPNLRINLRGEIGEREVITDESELARIEFLTELIKVIHLKYFPGYPLGEKDEGPIKRAAHEIYKISRDDWYFELSPWELVHNLIIHLDCKAADLEWNSTPHGGNY